MWHPQARRDERRHPRVAIWLRVLEVVLTAVLLAVTVWGILAGGP